MTLPTRSCRGRRHAHLVSIGLVLLVGLVAVGGCEDDLLGVERFAWATPEDKAAADAGANDAADDATASDSQQVDAAGGGDTQSGGSDAGAGVPDGGGKVCAADIDCLALDDGDRCNGLWHCDVGANPPVCAPKPKSNITCPGDADSDSLCAVSLCDPGTGACTLAARPDGTACDDGDSCTSEDSCASGVCIAGVPLACACTQDADCADQDDGNPCNGVWRCLGDSGAAACAIDPATVVACDKSADTSCVANACDPKSGQCVMAAVHEGDACAVAGNKCAGAASCQSGKCLASGAGECDDGNPCTANACDPASGCVFKSKVMDGKACDADGQPCESADTCKNGGCESGPPKDCDDGDPCTDDACDADTGACTHKKSC